MLLEIAVFIARTYLTFAITKSYLHLFTKYKF